jgi:uncharacterized protein (TIGR02996 family)
MTTLPAEFLAAVIAAPDDDLPRLVMADALDERGDPLGEFIRVQVALAACWFCRGQPESQWHRCPECRANRRREEELFKGGGFTPPVAWNATTVPGWDRELISAGPWLFVRRGFVEGVRCSWPDWLAAHTALYWHPDQPRDCPPGACPIRRVALTSGPVVRWDGRAGRNDRIYLADEAGNLIGDGIPDDHFGYVLADPRLPLLAASWPGLTFTLPEARNGLDNHPEFTAGTVVTMTAPACPQRTCRL